MFGDVAEIRAPVREQKAGVQPLELPFAHACQVSPHLRGGRLAI
jgi:hypothetical protein